MSNKIPDTNPVPFSIEFLQTDANTTLFPKAGADVKLHSGFQDTQGRTADVVLSTVQGALSDTGFTNVLVTGHSLGAAIASLDAMMLRMALPDSVNVSSVVFGLPRVGNQEWADLFDSLVSALLCYPSLVWMFRRRASCASSGRVARETCSIHCGRAVLIALVLEI